MHRMAFPITSTLLAFLYLGHFSTFWDTRSHSVPFLGLSPLPNGTSSKIFKLWWSEWPLWDPELAMHLDCLIENYFKKNLEQVQMHETSANVLNWTRMRVLFVPNVPKVNCNYSTHSGGGEVCDSHVAGVSVLRALLNFFGYNIPLCGLSPFPNGLPVANSLIFDVQ